MPQRPAVRNLVRSLASAALAAAAVTFLAAVPAHAAVTCNDIVALKAAVSAGGTVDLVPYCVYVLTAPTVGGGVDGLPLAALDDTRVSSNRIIGAQGQGAGIAALGGSLQLQNTTAADTVSDNLASGRYSKGGGIFTQTGATASVTGATITRNKATGTGSQGGGLYNIGVAVTITGTSITANRAQTAPGGVWTSVPLAPTTTTITGNTPTNCAGSPAAVTGCAT
ncbi:hypothetical protein [Streptomyces sp. NPDC086787]|uniref:hypothetical protein n=1 Tax=Streptomyces sp. NPDC086787 TaxID=3365759 RepID=UPI0038253A62